MYSLLRRVLHRSADARGGWRADGAVDEGVLHRVLATRITLRRLLDDNIVPFWMRGIVDDVHGGYRLNHDVTGTWQGPSPKYLVTQARTLWFHARMMRRLESARPAGSARDFQAAGGEYRAHQAAADAGFAFLRDRMWNAQDGGFHWAVDHSGEQVRADVQRAYGQAFALFALSEHARASARADVLELAHRTFALLETHFHDRLHGGYVAVRSAGSAGRAHPDVNAKIYNDHIHLLEALHAFGQVAPSPAVRDRAWEVILILARTITRSEHASSRDHHARDWRSHADDRMVSFGHDLETGWLLLDTCEAMTMSPTPLLPWSMEVFQVLRAYGLDRRDGSVYHLAQVGRRAHDRRRIWWVQAEVLVGCLDLFARTGSTAAGHAYLDLLRWIETRQADWEHGEWHHCITPGGSPEGYKAGEWRGPYHTARAMIECLDRVDRLSARES